MGAAAEFKGQANPWCLEKEKDARILWGGAGLRPIEFEEDHIVNTD
jgi:hypothetical protein